jgi:hypothetical protein
VESGAWNRAATLKGREILLDEAFRIPHASPPVIDNIIGAVPGCATCLLDLLSPVIPLAAGLR